LIAEAVSTAEAASDSFSFSFLEENDLNNEDYEDDESDKISSCTEHQLT